MKLAGDARLVYPLPCRKHFIAALDNPQPLKRWSPPSHATPLL